MTRAPASPRASPTRRVLRTVPWIAAALVVSTVVGVEWWVWSERPRDLPADWTGSTSVLAGDGTIGWRDGPTLGARFSEPFGVAASGDGTIFIADAGESPRIRAISPEGVVFTLAGGARGFLDGRGAAARFDTPSGLAIDGAGALYVADTANNAIRRITPEGDVTTVAGGPTPGFADGPAHLARFNGPIGIAVAADGRILVADTYNDRIRVIDADGVVTTVAGGPEPGFADGDGADARFDTPSGLAVAPDGTVLVADTGNGAIRAMDDAGRVSTPAHVPSLVRPTGVAVSPRGEIYATDDRGRIVAFGLQATAPGEGARVEGRTLAGAGAGFRDGGARQAEFRRPSGLAVLAEGRILVADAGNALVRVVSAASRMSPAPPASPRVQPAFDAPAFRLLPLLWPVDPMDGPHEIAGTLGEARGEGAERLHSGIDVRIEQGTPVRAIRDGVVDSPVAAGAFGTLNEWMRIGPVTYVHVRVGRSRGDRLYDRDRFVPRYDERGRLAGVRVKRGARFSTGEIIASVNAFNHVHLNVGWPGDEHNPLAFRLVNFEDTIAPTIPANGVRLHTAAGEPFTDRAGGRWVVSGQVQVVVDAWDQAEGNRPGRRLGLYSLGYQILRPNGIPVEGFETPSETIRFDRLAGGRTAASLIFAPGSGIPFYSGGRTRFLYTVTNTLRDGIASEGYWDTTELPPGDYTLRVWASDIAGNTTVRDVPVAVQQGDAES